MKELIERLEKATGPDRQLGNDILLACGWTMDEQGDGPSRMPFWIEPDGDCHNDGDQPDPTASLDAAMALVPEGAVWMVQTDYELPGRAHVNWLQPIHNEQIRPPENFGGDGANSAIALCIAALKARSS